MRGCSRARGRDGEKVARAWGCAAALLLAAWPSAAGLLPVNLGCEANSNAIYTALRFRVTRRDSCSQVATYAFIFNGFVSFELPYLKDRL